VLIFIFLANIFVKFTWIFIILVLPLKNSKISVLNRNIQLSTFLLIFLISLIEHYKRILIFAPSSEPYSLEIYPSDIFNIIKLSFEYNAFLFIVGIIFYIVIYILLKQQIGFFKKKLLNKIWLLIFIFFNFITIPFSIIDLKFFILNLEIIGNTTPSKTFNEIQGEIPELEGKYFCSQALSPLGESSFPAKTIGACRTTEDYCNKLKGLTLSNEPGDSDRLWKAKRECEDKGW
jgi:hypothetical protein